MQALVERIVQIHDHHHTGLHGDAVLRDVAHPDGGPEAQPSTWNPEVVRRLDKPGEAGLAPIRSPGQRPLGTEHLRERHQRRPKTLSSVYLASQYATIGPIWLGGEGRVMVTMASGVTSVRQPSRPPISMISYDLGCTAEPELKWRVFSSSKDWSGSFLRAF